MIQDKEGFRQNLKALRTELGRMGLEAVPQWVGPLKILDRMLADLMRPLIDFLPEFPNPHADQKYGNATLAQHGDDIMIVNIFALLRQKSVTWLDLGAHHPLNISNTALLYALGHTGVNVEANPALIDEFIKLRPNDVNVNVGVGLENTVAPYYMFGETSGRNTFSKAEVESLKGVLSVTKTIELPVVNVNEIVKRFCGGKWPDLLLTDIEGLDYEVLKEANFTEGNQPKVIVTEARLTSSLPVKKLLLDRGYFVYCRMGENLFFVLNELREKLY